MLQAEIKNQPLGWFCLLDYMVTSLHLTKYYMKTNLTTEQLQSRGRQISLTKRMPINEFIIRATNKHNNKYCYDKSIYKNAHTLLEIVCPIHGIFKQKPTEHLKGYGCLQCGNIQKGVSKKESSIRKFIEKATKYHNNKYEYDCSSYLGAKVPMRIICPIHGEFLQAPEVHTRSGGCRRCVSGPISVMSQSWLDSIGVSEEIREQWMIVDNKRIKVDALDLSSNTVYEFWGDYWHGNPRVYAGNKINQNNKKLFRDLYEDTQNRIALLKNAGFILIEMWEFDWLQSVSNSSTI